MILIIFLKVKKKNILIFSQVLRVKIIILKMEAIIKLMEEKKKIIKIIRIRDYQEKEKYYLIMKKMVRKQITKKAKMKNMKKIVMIIMIIKIIIIIKIMKMKK